jgi:general secretion pathway protein H
MTIPATRHGQSGVTLIEMMIVLAVIGVASGVATLGLGALARDNAAEQEAHRLATVIGLAVDDALISGVAGGLAWDAQSYRVDAGARHVLTPSVALARADGSSDAVVLSPNATTVPVDFILQDDTAIWRVSFDGLSAVVAPGLAP